jgi:hypothetical protein
MTIPVSTERRVEDWIDSQPVRYCDCPYHWGLGRVIPEGMPCYEWETFGGGKITICWQCMRKLSPLWSESRK